jgi:hypothetical protein
MSSVDIDQLRISIEAKAASARSELSGLASDVGKLKSNLGGSESAIRSFNTALDGLSGHNDAITSLGNLANAVGQLNGVKISSTIGKNLESLKQAASGFPDSTNLAAAANAVSKLNGVKISKTIGTSLEAASKGIESLNGTTIDASKFDKLSAALTTLANIPKNSLTSTFNALLKLKQVMDVLDNTDMGALATKCQQLSDALGNLPAKMQAVNSGLRTTVKYLQSSGGAFNTASSGVSGFISKLWSISKTVGSLAAIKGVFNTITNTIGSCVDKANRYVEDMNLFNVALGGYADQARGYAQQVSDAMGINIQDWLRNQGTFTTMAKGMGVAEDSAYTMGQQLTQLSYDLASLYNTTDTEAFEKVRAGLAGELEPLRALGYDLSVARLQQEAYNLGIDKSVSSMTQAEKAQLRYYAIMNQVTWAHGDMARSLDSPANAMRVFAGACNTAATNIGKIFLPMIKAIMPLCIQAAKTVATLANMLADLTGGNQIADVNYSGGGLGSMASDAEDAASALDDAGNAAGGTGSKAGKAAKQVKELKRQLMGFDEINMFSKQSDSSGSGGGGGGGGSGSGGGGGTGGGSIPIQTYDFLGNGNELSDRMKDMVDRLCKAWVPLLEAVKAVALAIRNQFRDLDIAGAAVNAFVAFNNLLSNFVRQCVEILGPLVVAFNFPETLALSFDLLAQMCLTLSAAINGVGTMVKNFSDTALIPLAAWIGTKLRDAIYLCIAVMQSWQDWFQENIQGLADLGKAAGEGAGLVLQLAMALADSAFSAAATIISGLNAVLQSLLTVLVNSGEAKVAVGLLAAALTALAIGNGIAIAIEALSGAFEKMAYSMASGSSDAAGRIKLLSTEVGSNLKKSLSDAEASIQLVYEAIKEKLSPVVDKAKTFFTNLGTAGINMGKSIVDGIKNVPQNFANLIAKVKSLTIETVKQKAAQLLANAQLALTSAQAKLAAAGMKVVATATTLAKTAVTGLKAALGGIIGLGISLLLTALVTHIGDIVDWMGNLIANVREACPPFNALCTAIEAVCGWIDSLTGGFLSTVGSWVGELLGISDATAKVTDNTKEANDVLAEEQRRVNDNLESMREYEKSHDNLSDALAVACMDEEKFQQYLTDTGQTFEDVKQKQDDFVNNTINGFEKIDASSQMSLDSVNENLASNIAVQQQWSDDLVTLMSQTGLDANSSLIKSLESAGPGKMSEALHEVVTNPTSEKSQEFLQLMSQAGEMSCAELAAAMKNGTGTVSEASGAVADAATVDVTEANYNSGTEAVDGFSSGLTDATADATAAAKGVSDAVVQSFNGGDGYLAAFDAGRNMSGGLGDGIADAQPDATTKAASVMSAAVEAFNGGTGYNQAKSAGKNLAGGYADGISAAAGQSKSKAQAAMNAVVQALNGGSGTSGARGAGTQLMQGYLNGIQSLVSSVSSAASGARAKVVTALNGGAGTSAARAAGSQLMGGYRSGLQSQVASAAGTARSAASQVASALQSKAGAAMSAGSQTIGGYVSGLRAGASAAGSAGSGAAWNAVSGLSHGGSGAYTSGRNLMQGYIDGINSKSSSVYWAAYNTAKRAVDAVNRAQRSHSPSKLTFKSGVWFGEGYENGIDSMGSSVASTVKSMVSDALDVTSAASKMGAAAGESYSKALGGSIDPASIANILSYGESQARTADVSYGSKYAPAATRHAQTAWETDDALMTQTIASAVARGVLSVQTVGGSSKASGGDTTIVLRVGNEDIARASLKGQASLARRGVVEFG